MTSPIRLSPNQQRVVDCRGSHLQVIACAGSGKTESISRRVASLIAEGADPASIVAFTFTERAAAELKERIVRRVEERMGSDFLDRLGPMFVGTIHSYCFRILQDHVPRYGNYDVLDDHRHAGLLSREYRQLRLSKLGNRHWLPIRDFIRTADVIGNELIDPWRLTGTPLGECYCAYREMLDRYHFLTFSLIISCALEALDEDPAIYDRVHGPLRNQSAYLARMTQLLRADGVTFPDNQHRDFARIEPLFESTESGGSLIHAEGLWQGADDTEPNNVAIGFGPQYGPVTALQVEELIRASRRYDELVIAGFSFDAAASAVIQESSHPRLRIHQAYIRPDVNPGMDGLLKDTPNSQLFTVFGQPDIEARADGDGKWNCELLGVDIYDPLTSEVRSTGASKVAAWFLDQDYDGRCFCITQAFFPDQKAWTKIAKALGSSADPEAFAAFEGTVSLPFPTGKHRRIAVKVIDPRGNEVMAVKKLES